jgi:hypothetical protein
MPREEITCEDLEMEVNIMMKILINRHGADWIYLV